MPKGGKEAFLSKVRFRRESNWYSRTKQMLKDMATIEERAFKALYDWDFDIFYHTSELTEDSFKDGYVQGAMEQKAIGINEACRMLCKTCEGGNGTGRPCIKPCHRYVGFKKGLGD